MAHYRQSTGRRVCGAHCTRRPQPFALPWKTLGSTATGGAILHFGTALPIMVNKNG